jgi:hypothetical protein
MKIKMRRAMLRDKETGEPIDIECISEDNTLGVATWQGLDGVLYYTEIEVYPTNFEFIEFLDD